MTTPIALLRRSGGNFTRGEGRKGNRAGRPQLYPGVPARRYVVLLPAHLESAAALLGHGSVSRGASRALEACALALPEEARGLSVNRVRFICTKAARFDDQALQSEYEQLSQWITAAQRAMLSIGDPARRAEVAAGLVRDIAEYRLVEVEKLRAEVATLRGAAKKQALHRTALEAARALQEEIGCPHRLWKAGQTECIECKVAEARATEEMEREDAEQEARDKAQEAADAATDTSWLDGDEDEDEPATGDEDGEDDED